MIVTFPKGEGLGTSFKGAFAYYLHDKRTEEQQLEGAEVTTKERVEWASLRNMPTDDIDRAANWMAYTAKNQDQLKAQAGISKTGRKSNKHVLAVSLSWEPSETPTRADMEKAAESFLSEFKLTDYQAAIIAHNDTKHPHIHIVLNRVSPKDGRMVSLTRSNLRAERWALDYERQRGHIFHPERVEKLALNEERAKRLNKDFSRNAATSNYHKRPDPAQPRPANDRPDVLATVKNEQRAKDAKLSQNTASMHERHSAQWKKLGGDTKARNQAIKSAAVRAEKRARDENKADYKPQWRDLYRKQEQQRDKFAAREARIAGKIRNAIDAMRFTKVSQHGEGDRNWLASAFNFLNSSQARESALLRLQGRERRELGDKQRANLGHAIRTIRRERAAAFKNSAQTHGEAREKLIADQKQDKTASRQAWRERNTQRKAVFASAAHAIKQEQARERVRAALKHLPPKSAPGTPPPPARKDEFSRAADPDGKIAAQRREAAKLAGQYLRASSPAKKQDAAPPKRETPEKSPEQTATNPRPRSKERAPRKPRNRASRTMSRPRTRGPTRTPD